MLLLTEPDVYRLLSIVLKIKLIDKEESEYDYLHIILFPISVLLSNKNSLALYKGRGSFYWIKAIYDLFILFYFIAIQTKIEFKWCGAVLYSTLSLMIPFFVLVAIESVWLSASGSAVVVK